MIGLMYGGRLDWVEGLSWADLLRVRTLDAEYDLIRVARQEVAHGAPRPR